MREWVGPASQISPISLNRHFPLMTTRTRTRSTEPKGPPANLLDELGHDSACVSISALDLADIENNILSEAKFRWNGTLEKIKTDHWSKLDKDHGDFLNLETVHDPLIPVKHRDFPKLKGKTVLTLREALEVAEGKLQGIHHDYILQLKENAMRVGSGRGQDKDFPRNFFKMLLNSSMTVFAADTWSPSDGSKRSFKRRVYDEVEKMVKPYRDEHGKTSGSLWVQDSCQCLVQNVCRKRTSPGRLEDELAFTWYVPMLLQPSPNRKSSSDGDPRKPKGCIKRVFLFSCYKMSLRGEIANSSGISGCKDDLSAALSERHKSEDSRSSIESHHSLRYTNPFSQHKLSPTGGSTTPQSTDMYDRTEWGSTSSASQRNSIGSSPSSSDSEWAPISALASKVSNSISPAGSVSGQPQRSSKRRRLWPISGSK